MYHMKSKGKIGEVCMSSELLSRHCVDASEASSNKYVVFICVVSFRVTEVAVLVLLICAEMRLYTICDWLNPCGPLITCRVHVVS